MQYKRSKIILAAIMTTTICLLTSCSMAKTAGNIASEKQSLRRHMTLLRQRLQRRTMMTRRFRRLLKDFLIW